VHGPILQRCVRLLLRNEGWMSAPIRRPADVRDRYIQVGRSIRTCLELEQASPLELEGNERRQFPPSSLALRPFLLPLSRRARFSKLVYEIKTHCNPRCDNRCAKAPTYCAYASDSKLSLVGHAGKIIRSRSVSGEALACERCYQVIYQNQPAWAIGKLADHANDVHALALSV